MSALREMNAQHSGDTPIVLATLYAGGTAVRLSSDPTQRFSVEPLLYGTMHEGQQHLFVLMTAQLPDDMQDSPMAVSLVFENVSSDMVALARSTLDPVTVDLKLVFRSNPDLIEAEYTGLEATRCRYGADTVSVDFSRERFMAIYFPSFTFGLNTFQSLHAPA